MRAAIAPTEALGVSAATAPPRLDVTPKRNAPDHHREHEQGPPRRLISEEKPSRSQVWQGIRVVNVGKGEQIRQMAIRTTTFGTSSFLTAWNSAPTPSSYFWPDGIRGGGNVPMIRSGDTTTGKVAHRIDKIANTTVGWYRSAAFRRLKSVALPGIGLVLYNMTRARTEKFK